MFLATSGQAVISVEPQKHILLDSPSLSLASEWSLLTVVVRKLLQTQQTWVFLCGTCIEEMLHCIHTLQPWCWQRRTGVRAGGLYGYPSTLWSCEDSCISLERWSICFLLLSHQCALRDGIWIKKGQYIVPTTVISVSRFLGDTQVLGRERGGSTRSKLSEGLEGMGWMGRNAEGVRRTWPGIITWYFYCRQPFVLYNLGRCLCNS